MSYQNIITSLKGTAGVASLLLATSAFAFQAFESVGSENTTEIITATPDESNVAAVPEPKTAWEWYYQGYQQLRDGEAREAVESFTMALELKPDHVRSMINMARAYVTLGQFEEAETIVREAIATDSTNSWAYHVLGRVLQSGGNTEEAIIAYETSLELDGNNPWTRNNLGLIRILQGNYAVAVELLEAAVETRDSVPYFFNNLGMAYEGTRDFEKARDAFAKALDLDMGNSKASTNLARIKKLLGEESTVEMPELEKQEETLIGPVSNENEWGEPTYESSNVVSESGFGKTVDRSHGSEYSSATIDYTSNSGDGRHSKTVAVGIAIVGLAVAFAVVIAIRSKKRYGYSA